MSDEPIFDQGATYATTACVVSRDKQREISRYLPVRKELSYAYDFASVLRDHRDYARR